MLDHILIVELRIPPGDEAEWNRWYHQEHMPSLLAEVPSIQRGTRYQLVDGDAEFGYIVLYEFPSAESLRAFMHSTTIQRKHGEYRQRWGVLNRRGGYQRVFKMGREGPQRQPVPRLDRGELGEAPRDILTVRLPVPPGREAEWNRWYDEQHMPSVMAQVGAINIGHRFAPFDDEPDAPYFVLYEFSSAQALRDWQDSAEVRQRRDEYSNRWGVRNTRRAFRAVFELRQGSRS